MAFLSEVSWLVYPMAVSILPKTHQGLKSAVVLAEDTGKLGVEDSLRGQPIP